MRLVRTHLSVLLLGCAVARCGVLPGRAAQPAMLAGRATKTAKRPAATRSKGFGAAPAAAASGPRKRWAEGAPDEALASALAALEEAGPSIVNYLNPALFDDPETLVDVGRRLRAGEVVILRDAFRPEFAEAAHRELRSKHVPWSLNEAYFPDGYAYRHENVYDHSQFSVQMNKTFEVFASEETKRWISELTQRDCSSTCTGAPSRYRPGDHSLPHTDWAGQRTVAYVWHLSTDWKPEWGGALYWACNDHNEATFPASFNSLCLFSVTTVSAHFVTTVSPHAKQQRLAFNGWWQSGWEPSCEDDAALEAALESRESRGRLTHHQMQAITDLLSDPWQNIPAERRERLDTLRSELYRDFFPEPPRAGIEA